MKDKEWPGKDDAEEQGENSGDNTKPDPALESVDERGKAEAAQPDTKLQSWVEFGDHATAETPGGQTRQEQAELAPSDEE